MKHILFPIIFTTSLIGCDNKSSSPPANQSNKLPAATDDTTIIKNQFPAVAFD